MIKRILIVDDETYKRQQIKNYITKHFIGIACDSCESLNKGLLKIIQHPYNLVLLDMSLPIYDKNETGSFNSYGGLDFLSEMIRKNINTPVIIITQYEILGEGKNQRTAASIDEECKFHYPNYKGMIIYSSINNNWKEQLLIKIGELNNGENISC